MSGTSDRQAFVDAQQSVCDLIDMLDKANAEIARLRARVSELESRLEVDHAFRLEGGKLVRFEIPPEERGNFPDGISCRDETIKLLEEQLGRKST